MRSFPLLLALAGAVAGFLVACQPTLGDFNCTKSSQCPAGEVCSVDLVCVPDPFPLTGGIGGSGGTGGQSGAGGSPGTGGRGGNGGAGGGGSSVKDAGSTSCGGELFQSTRLAANMLVVLDRSGSMSEYAAVSPTGQGITKMESARAAVKKLAMENAGKIFMGLETFPTAVTLATCGAGQVLVPVGPSTATEITNALNTTVPGGSTPLAAALALARTQAALKDPVRAKYVLLVTDGAESCDPTDGAAVNEVKKLADAGVKTFVVGFGTGVDPNTLNGMAFAGGTMKSTGTWYYQAHKPDELDAALASIAAGAVGCDYKLSKTPPDIAKIYVYVAGVLQARNPSHTGGWDYSAATGKLTLYGATCDTVSKNPSTKVTIVYGCPDTELVETTPTSDAGVFQ